MTDDSDWLPDVHFGVVGGPRPVYDADEDFDPDDELEEASPELIAMLGGDPSDIIREGTACQNDDDVNPAFSFKGVPTEDKKA